MLASLHLTQSCNLRCSYCYAGEKSSNVMSGEVARRAIDFLFDELDDPYLGVTFFGGEPLLAFDLIQSVVAHAKDRAADRAGLRLRFAVNTNGTLLDDEIVRFIQAENVHVMLSIDGVAEAQDAHRLFVGKQSSFATVDASLTTLLEICPLLDTISVVTPENVEYLPDSVTYLTGKGVRVIQLSPDYCASWNEEDFARLTGAYQQLGDLYVELYRQDRGVMVNLIDSRLDVGAPNDQQTRSICKLADGEISIAPDGTIFPCVQFVNSETVVSKKHAVGDVFTGWQATERAEIIRQSREPSPKCTACEHNGRCVNYCGCTNVRTTGKVNEMSDFGCAHEKMLLPIVDRVRETLFKEGNRLFLAKYTHPHLPLVL